MLHSDPGRHVFLYMVGLHCWENEIGGGMSALDGYYDALDEILGTLVAAGDGNTTYVLFSERGNPEGGIPWRPRFPQLEASPPVGFFMAWGRDVRRAAHAVTVAPPDLAATLLYLSNNPLPTDMDGAVLFGMIDERVYARRRPLFRR
jgi:hypothetical protein